MGIRLRVPLVKQQASNECWYVATMMVAYYRRIGPRVGLKDKWIANKGIEPNDFMNLAEAEGMLPIPKAHQSAHWNPERLEKLLKSCGPIWCAGFWDGVGHIVVLTGVVSDTVYINDPNPAQGMRTESVAWFNQKLAKNLPNPMMYMTT